MIDLSALDGVQISQAFGFLAALPAIASGIGSIFGGAAGSKANERMAQSQLIQQQNRNAIDQYQAQQQAQMQAGNLDLQRKGFEESARGGRAKQAAIASLLQNMQDVAINVPGIKTASITGGLRPSALGEGGRASMAELYKQAMLKQMTPDQFTGGQILNAPQMQAMPKPGKLEKFLNIAGLVGSTVGGIGGKDYVAQAMTPQIAEQTAKPYQNLFRS